MAVSIPDAYERATEGRPFSNSTQWEIWAANWCYRCANDGLGIGEDEPNCDLICVALCGRTPSEWLRQEPGSPDEYHCVYFRDRDDPGGREPEPIPDPPGQLPLLPREPYEGVRMPLTAPEREAVSA